jgi:large subunit ribosomal protein L25
MLEGIVRDSIEKPATKKLRRDGYLIANIYGKGIENINAAFKKNEFIKALRAKEDIIFPIKVDGKELKVVVQEYQKNPVTNDLLHVDLMVATEGVKAGYKVPITVEGTPKGLKNKGLFIYHRKRIAVKCAPENLPKAFHFNVSDLDVGDNLLVRDIELPEGVDCFLNSSVPVVGVIKAR